MLPPFIPIPDPYSETVQDLLKLTNLRINFTELHTLGDTLLDNRPEISEKYYYALYDVTVRGSCSCYGHASRCLPVPGYNRSDEISRNMVHGQCECTHNTKGMNCELCEDFYHDLPWRPARPNQPNICKKCECNNHSKQCHFDAAKFRASGDRSGGVCDNCEDNTQGVNCQDCKPFYYQDPNRDIRSPSICQPCDCDPLGSEDNGLCEQVTDERAMTIAGRCRCKAFVEGPRCDRCVENYWNLRRENPLGCEACSCNLEGTLPDAGCDQDTGSCFCKRYVTGKNCDQCYPGFYGLSKDEKYGCKSCQCDIGGAYSFECDQTTGQCDCRNHIQGQRCDEVRPGFFFACLDHYKSEAEYGRGENNARVYIREKTPGSPNYWTGSGYMRVFEGDSIEFTVSGLPFSTFYDIVVRYDLRMPEDFEDVSVSVIRLAAIDPDSVCADINPRDDLKQTSLLAGSRYQIVNPPSCLEASTTYTVRMDFNQYSRGRQMPEATLLIDSILIVPNVDYIPIYMGDGMGEYMKQEFLHHRCDIMQFSSPKSELSEICKKHTHSISAVHHRGALDCNCDITGSTSTECDVECGQCKCKPNVVGRRCDQCAPGFYGFGPNGCKPCNCNATGSSDNFCDDVTGQCTCDQNIASRTCSECRYGFWGFPQCRKCQCNGNADTCDQDNGACLSCRNNTSGNNCERCEDGYYGEPSAGYRIPCRPCMCPGGPDSSMQHADRCRFDRRTNDVYCECKLGYRGPNCDTCIDNYYGDPTAVDGKCEPCVCNNNIDPNVPGSCDSDTGECLKCMHHTTGFACEHCETGYHGNATIQNCARCICNELGTNKSLGECDRVSGQCPCLPNVIGKSCDQCAADHWDLGSGEGCKACGCDGLGSTDSQCNQLDGQCECKDGRGGPKCADCEDLNFGDPLDQCFPCDCNMQGSTGRQCDRRSGQCPCIEGVTGEKCDRCARGTTGDLPNCVPCGECFDNWDKIIQELKGQTHEIVKRASKVSVTGVLMAFDKDFKMMQENLDDINKILSNVNYTSGDIQELMQMLKQVKEKMNNNTIRLDDVDNGLIEINAKVIRGNLTIQLLRDDVEKLKKLAMELKNNATNIQILEVSGAFEKIKEAERDSQTAQNLVDSTGPILKESESLREETERMIKNREAEYNRKLEDNRDRLDSLDNDIDQLESNLADINSMVCGGVTSPCDSLCGGGGCGICGGAGCSGAVSSAKSAADMAATIEKLLKEKAMNATDQLIPKIQDAKREAMEAKEDSVMAYQSADKARNATEATKAQLEKLSDDIRSFIMGEESAQPENIKKITEEVLNMSLPMDKNQIKQLADEINKAIESLTDINKILAETEESRNIAMKLQKRANEASSDAKNIRENAEGVLKALNETKQSQEIAKKAIEQAKMDIASAEDDFTKIDQITEEVSALTGNSKGLLNTIKQQLMEMQQKYTEMKEVQLKKAQDITMEAENRAQEAYDKATDLLKKYQETSDMVNDDHGSTDTTKKRADRLKARADALQKAVDLKKRKLGELDNNIKDNDKKVENVSKEIDDLLKKMNDYIVVINSRQTMYDHC